MRPSTPRVAVVIPCFRVRRHIDGVLSRIGPEVSHIYVVDDCCPEETGDHVHGTCNDPRVMVLRHEHNAGVGGAVITGYEQALRDGVDVVVKIDGDGQMEPELLPQFVAPILLEEADYTKGNRFFRLESLRGMPWKRLLGNAVLSFFSKLSTGYWRIFDPTNGYTAINAAVLAELPLRKLSQRYFFESDMLFRLGTMRAVVQDIPMAAKYDDETSSLRIAKILGPFLLGHGRNLGKRIFYGYFLRDFSVASCELLGGMALFLGGCGYGAWAWWRSIASGQVATPGKVMLAALPVLLGVQLLLAFLNYDIQGTPASPLAPRLRQRRDTAARMGPRSSAPGRREHADAQDQGEGSVAGRIGGA